MSDFRILRENAKDNDKFWHTFKLDSFKFNEGNVTALTESQVHYIVDKFEFLEQIPEVELTSELVHCLYINSGGSEDTKPVEILGFSYLLYSSPNLRLADIFATVAQATHFNTTLKFLLENDRAVPSQYITESKTLIESEAVFYMILSRYPELTIDSKMPDDTYIEWLTAAIVDVSDYIKGVNATNDIQKLF